MKPKVSEWEKEYSQIILEWIESQWAIEKAHQDCKPYTRLSFEADANRVENKLKAFIQQTLTQQKAEMVEMVREMKIRHITKTKDKLDEYEDGVNNDWVDAVNEAQLEIQGYNQALNDIIKRLEGE